MKVLMIGMDGAHIEAFRRGWTPYISSLINQGQQIKIENDLISRGWLEIATGKHASITGAMYDKPVMNGSYDWNHNFSINDIPGINDTIKPIWQVLNENNVRVGVMNLPTVYPAPEVDGFFVSGGGGGAPVVEQAIPELCFPKEILSILRKNEYIVDERIVQLVVEKKFTTPDLIFEELAKKNQKRTVSFIELAKKYDIEFGFVVYKTSSVTAETILAPEWQRVLDGLGEEDQETIGALKQYYERFDAEIKKLKEAFPQAEVVLVSDHGTVSRTHTVNLNIFLKKYGYQYALASKGFRQSFINFAKKVIPFTIKVRLQKLKAVKKAVDSVEFFDSSKTYAFCHTKNDWNHGIFINDEERFGGPVRTNDIEKVKKEIIENFNSEPLVNQHGLFAYSVKENVENPIKYFPDIVVSLPSGYLTNNSSKEFISKFNRPHRVSSLSSVLRGDIISMKSHEPLVVDCEEDKTISGSYYDGMNLTSVYDLILKKFSLKNN